MFRYSGTLKVGRPVLRNTGTPGELSTLAGDNPRPLVISCNRLKVWTGYTVPTVGGPPRDTRVSEGARSGAMVLGADRFRVGELP